MTHGTTRAALALIAGLAAGSGCATMGTMQTADVVGEGNMELGVEPSYLGLATDGGGGGFVQLGISGRFGVTPRTDIGFRVATNGGAEFLTKFALTDPTSDGIKIALAPGGGGMLLAAGGGAAGVLHFQIPLIIGIPIGGSQLVLAPKIHEWLVFAAGGGDGGGGAFTSAGASIGFAGRVSPSLRLLPEVALLTPILASGTVTGIGTESEVLAGEAVFMQISFCFLIGGPKTEGG